MACWDIVGKALGQPVYRLLGGAVRDRIKAYANGWYTVERTPEEFHAAAQAGDRARLPGAEVRPVRRRGASSSTTSERMRSVALVEAVRDAVGPDVEILVEMHGRFAAARGDPDRRGARAVRAGLARGAGAAGEPRGAGEGRRAHAASRSRPASASTTGSSSASCSSRQARGHHPARHRPLRRHPRDRASWRRRPRRTTCWSRRTTSAGRSLTAANLHLGRVHAELQDPGALQRLRRPRRCCEAAPGLPPVGVDGCFALPDAPGLGVTLDVDFVAERPQHRRALRPLRSTTGSFRGTK